MSREVRMVPTGWEHPRDAQGKYIPMEYGYQEIQREYNDRVAQYGADEAMDYFGGPIIKENYMLADTPREACPYWMMYETTSMGTPISPAFLSAEELARWLANNNASAFGSRTATYDQWLAVCGRGR